MLLIFDFSVLARRPELPPRFVALAEPVIAARLAIARFRLDPGLSAFEATVARAFLGRYLAVENGLGRSPLDRGALGSLVERLDEEFAKYLQLVRVETGQWRIFEKPHIHGIE